jgi:hypothetical protein
MSVALGAAASAAAERRSCAPACWTATTSCGGHVAGDLGLLNPALRVASPPRLARRHRSIVAAALGVLFTDLAIGLGRIDRIFAGV